MSFRKLIHIWKNKINNPCLKYDLIQFYEKERKREKSTYALLL